MKNSLNIWLVAIAFVWLIEYAPCAAGTTAPRRIGNANLQVTIDKATGLPSGDPGASAAAGLLLPPR